MLLSQLLDLACECPGFPQVNVISLPTMLLLVLRSFYGSYAFVLCFAQIVLFLGNKNSPNPGIASLHA